MNREGVNRVMKTLEMVSLFWHLPNGQDHELGS